MTDQPALPPRRSLTAGRELPPKRGEALGTAPAPVPRASRQGIEHRPVASPAAAAERRPPKRPDPRPMRIVYGAGAVAAMSVMAVGLVQPDWTSTADQGPTDDSYATDPGAVAALPDGKAEVGPTDSTQGTGEGAANVKVRHVTQYIYLRPGQTAPPGATVISATARPPRAGRNHSSNPDPTATPRPQQHNGGGNNNGSGPVSATPRPTPRPTQAPAATPRPTPRPTPTSRQSGHH